LPDDSRGVDRLVEVVGMEHRKAARNPPLGGRPLMAGMFGVRESAHWRYQSGRQVPGRKFNRLSVKARPTAGARSHGSEARSQTSSSKAIAEALMWFATDRDRQSKSACAVRWSGRAKAPVQPTDRSISAAQGCIVFPSRARWRGALLRLNRTTWNRCTAQPALSRTRQARAFAANAGERLRCSARLATSR
jgi:hypothetical protein